MSTAQARSSTSRRLAVAVVGAGGRMGTLATQAISAADDLELVAGLRRGDSRDLLRRATVVVDLTRPDVVMQTARWCIGNGVHCVIGTSGIDAARQRELTELLAEAPGVGVLVVPNFAIGAVLAMSFARRAARWFAAAEVIELHHAGKADAPSGTAAATAAGIADARRAAGSGPMPDATTADPDGARGAAVDGVHVHSVRLPGLVAHQEVLLGNPGELLTLRHDSFDRQSFVPGLLLAVRRVPQLPGLTVGLDAVLDLG